jgi:hypothetical protein
MGKVVPSTCCVTTPSFSSTSHWAIIGSFSILACWAIVTPYYSISTCWATTSSS